MFFFSSTDISLAPVGGWGRWINGKVAPEKLKRDVSMDVRTSSGFSVSILCNRQASTKRCVLSNGVHDAEYDVMLTIPRLLKNDNTKVERLPILMGERNSFKVSDYFSANNARLHAEVNESQIREMLNYPGTTYNGQFTLIFDEEM